MRSGSMDNFWLVIAVRYGIPGLLLLGSGYIIGLVRIMRRDFTSDRILAQFRRAWVFTFMGLTFTLCTVFVWASIYSFVFFFFGAGMWLITAQAKSESHVAPEAGPQTVDSAATRSPYSRFPYRKVASRQVPAPVTIAKQQ